jgi:hypothetical protein
MIVSFYKVSKTKSIIVPGNVIAYISIFYLFDAFLTLKEINDASIQE